MPPCKVANADAWSDVPMASKGIKRMLPVMLAAAEKLQAGLPDIQFILPQADSIGDELLEVYKFAPNQFCRPHEL